MRRLGPYELVKRLGLSSTSEIYEARHLESGKHVAIKRALPHAWEDPAHRARFDREIALVMQQTHPGLVRGLDVVMAPSITERSGDPCLVMHFVEGTSLRALLDCVGVTTPPEAALVHAAMTLAESLSALHAAADHPIVHGDLSAGNVLVDRDGTFTVLDLGSAAPQGEPSTDLGTPRYTPPERQPGAPLTTTGDVYSLGVLLWEVASGRRWPTEAPRQLPESSTLNGTALGALIKRCIASDPSTRPTDAAMVWQAAAACATHDGRDAWCQWLSTAIDQPESASDLSKTKGQRAWIGLTLAVGLAVWTASWFITQML
jgi:eukaryotic-like serine/threonine-protein kinase